MVAVPSASSPDCFDAADRHAAALLLALAGNASLATLLPRLRALEPGHRLALDDLLRWLPPPDAVGVHGPAVAARVDHWLKVGAAAGLAPIPCTSPQYPKLVRELSDAPPVLWVSGLAQVLSEPAIAVVGARDCSLSAARLATSLARDLAATGLVVVSGLARGIDAAAHRGALEGGHTVAVLGSGADIVYPAEHRALAVQVRARGALISEYPPGTRPKAWHFPRRNRIIAGLAVAVVVVEASETSGALITTREALDQGKEVMVVPGSVVAGRNRGGHALLKDGAALVENARDVLDVLRGSPLLAMAALRTEPRGSPQNNRPLAVETSLPDRWAVGEELDLDDLKELVSGHLPTIPRRLLEWELAGLVARTPLGRFVRLCR